MSIFRKLLEKPKNTGFRFGFISILLIGIALIYPSFYNLGYSDPTLQHWTFMLVIGLMMSMMFTTALRNQSMTIDTGMTGDAVYKQLRVVVIGVAAGFGLVMTQIFTNVGLGVIDASMTNGFFMGVLAGVAEELFFRGFVQTMIRIYVPFLILAVLPSAFIFALFHYFAYGLAVEALVILFMLGIFLGLLHEIFNDIGVPMIAHIVNNVFAMLPAVVAAVTGSIWILLLLLGVAVVSYTVAFLRR